MRLLTTFLILAALVAPALADSDAFAVTSPAGPFYRDLLPGVDDTYHAGDASHRFKSLRLAPQAVAPSSVSSGAIYVGTNGTIYRRYAGAWGAVGGSAASFDDIATSPYADGSNTRDLGKDDRRWRTGYFGTGVHTPALESADGTACATLADSTGAIRFGGAANFAAGATGTTWVGSSYVSGSGLRGGTLTDQAGTGTPSATYGLQTPATIGIGVGTAPSLLAPTLRLYDCGATLPLPGAHVASLAYSEALGCVGAQTATGRAHVALDDVYMTGGAGVGTGRVGVNTAGGNTMQFQLAGSPALPGSVTVGSVTTAAGGTWTLPALNLGAGSGAAAGQLVAVAAASGILASFDDGQEGGTRAYVGSVRSSATDIDVVFHVNDDDEEELFLWDDGDDRWEFDDDVYTLGSVVANSGLASGANGWGVSTGSSPWGKIGYRWGDNADGTIPFPGANMAAAVYEKDTDVLSFTYDTAGFLPLNAGGYVCGTTPNSRRVSIVLGGTNSDRWVFKGPTNQTDAMPSVDMASITTYGFIPFTAASPPTGITTPEGLQYYDTTQHKSYTWNGSEYVAHF